MVAGPGTVRNPHTRQTTCRGGQRTRERSRAARHASFKFPIINYVNYQTAVASLFLLSLPSLRLWRSTFQSRGFSLDLHVAIESVLQPDIISIPIIHTGKGNTISLHNTCLNIPTFIILSTTTILHPFSLIAR